MEKNFTTKLPRTTLEKKAHLPLLPRSRGWYGVEYGGPHPGYPLTAMDAVEAPSHAVRHSQLLRGGEVVHFERGE